MYEPRRGVVHPLPVRRRRQTLFTALQYLGLILMVTSLPFTASGLVGLLLWSGRSMAEFRVASELLASGVVLVLVGLLLSRAPGGLLGKGDAVFITVATWLSVPLFSAALMSEILDIPYVDALLETVAGWTTTGLSILTGAESSSGGYVPSVDEIPESVKLWRSMLQWVGGVGIVVFTVAFLARPGISAAALYIAEGRFERLEASLKASAIRMTLVYMVYTLLGALIIYLSGMSLSDAIQHSMTAISTAGFSTHADSVGFYKGDYAVYASTLLVSFLGALSFVDLDNIMRLRLGRVLRSVEFRVIAGLTALSAAAAAAVWYIDPVMRSSYTLADTIYNSVSGYITVGFSTASLEGASDSYKLLIAALGLIGGSAFSTAGGIKVLRLAIALKTLDVETTRILKPSSYVPKNLIGGRRLTEDMVKRSLAVIIAFATVEILLGLTAVALYSDIYPTVDIIFDVTSALANIGLSTGVTSPEAPTGLKVILIAGMLLGRLEILPYIVAAKYLVESVRART